MICSLIFLNAKILLYAVIVNPTILLGALSIGEINHFQLQHNETKAGQNLSLFHEMPYDKAVSNPRLL